MAARLIKRPAIRSFAWGCLVLGFIGTLATLATGFIDMSRTDLRHDTHVLVDLHWKVGVVFAVALTIAVLWRWAGRKSAVTSSGFLVYFTTVFALLCLQGWFGGEIAHAHGAGVAAAGQGTVSPATAAARTERVASVLRQLPWFGSEESGESHRQPHSGK